MLDSTPPNSMQGNLIGFHHIHNNIDENLDDSKCATYVEIWIQSVCISKWFIFSQPLQARFTWCNQVPLGIAQPAWVRQFQLTHLSLTKMANDLQMTFSNASSWMETFEPQIKFHWNVFLRFIDNESALPLVEARHLTGKKPLPEPMLTKMPDAITRP